MQQVVNQPG